MSFDTTATREQRKTYLNVEAPFEPSRSPLDAVGELAAQMHNALLSLSPELREKAVAMFMGAFPISTEPEEDNTVHI